MALDFDAYVFWGIDCGDDQAFDGDLVWDGWKDRWAALRGAKTREEIAGLLKATCTMHPLGAQDSELRVYAWVTASAIQATPWRATPFTVPPIDPAWEPLLREFTTALSLPWRPPRWILASYWSP